MINSTELEAKESKEAKEALEKLREKLHLEHHILDQLKKQHKDKIASIIKDIRHELTLIHVPGMSAIVSNPTPIRNFISYEYFIQLMTSIKSEELESLDKISLDSWLERHGDEIIFEQQNAQHLLNSLKSLKINTLKMLHAIINHEPELVLKLLEHNVIPDFSVFDIFIMHFLFNEIVMNPFSEMENSTYLRLFDVFDNPDVILINPQHANKNKALQTLESLLCYGYQPGYLSYNIPGVPLKGLYDGINQNEDLILQVLFKKSYLVNHFRAIDKTHATLLIPSITSEICSRLQNCLPTLIWEFFGFFTQEMEEISEMIMAEQQKIEKNPVEAGLSKFMEGSKLESLLPCRPVATLVFKYASDPMKNVFDILQKELRYKYIYNRIIPIG